jgi:uroporphyrinogen decarboxylase
MKTTPLSSRERVRLALNHQATDRVPIAMVCSGINPPVDAAFDRLLRAQHGTSRAAYLDSILDIAGVEPDYIGPPRPPGVDIWGVRRRSFSYGPGAYDEIEHYPLAGAKNIDAVLAHPWPNPDWFDYSSLPSKIERLQAGRERCLMIHNANIFETTWYMRGLEQTFLDFSDQPELIHCVLEKTTAFYMEYFRRQLEAAAGQVDLAFTADDIGGQNGLLMSLPTWARFIKPYHQRLNQVIHEFGVKVIYHTDGAVMKAVPGLIEMGIDVLQALQFSARGMDPVEMKSSYGDRLCFEGGISVQTTLPFGTVEEVIEETRERIRVLGQAGGYILGPSHAIQAGTPAENVLAMFETAVHSPME